MMPRRRLGSHGPEVGAVGLGAMGMSWAYNDVAERADRESEHVRLIAGALDLGTTLLDTADLYGPFTNESLLGRALRGRRSEVTLATKGGLTSTDPEVHQVERNGRPSHLRHAIRASLRRLQTDHVDLYYLHRVDDQVPFDEQWGTLAEFVGQGLARHIGLSEVTVEQLDAAHAQHPVTAVQSELSLWTRDHIDVVRWCKHNDAAFVAFAPLGRGFLAGDLSSSEQLGQADFRRSNPRYSSEALTANQRIVDVVRVIADRHDATPAQVAVAWVLAQGQHVVPIPGTTRLTHLRSNAAAARLSLESADLSLLDALPSPAGERY